MVRCIAWPGTLPASRRREVEDAYKFGAEVQGQKEGYCSSPGPGKEGRRCLLSQMVKCSVSSPPSLPQRSGLSVGGIAFLRELSISSVNGSVPAMGTMVFPLMVERGT